MLVQEVVGAGAGAVCGEETTWWTGDGAAWVGEAALWVGDGDGATWVGGDGYLGWGWRHHHPIAGRRHHNRMEEAPNKALFSCVLGSLVVAVTMPNNRNTHNNVTLDLDIFHGTNYLQTVGTFQKKEVLGVIVTRKKYELDNFGTNSQSQFGTNFDISTCTQIMILCCNLVFYHHTQHRQIQKILLCFWKTCIIFRFYYFHERLPNPFKLTTSNSIQICDNFGRHE